MWHPYGVSSSKSALVKAAIGLAPPSFSPRNAAAAAQEEALVMGSEPAGQALVLK